MYTLHFDGLFRGIPGGESGAAAGAGFMSFGWLIFQEERVIAKGHGVFARHKDATSNVAEYLGLIEGLEALRDLGIQDASIQICGDAKSIIDQMQGLALVNSPRMKPLYRKARKLAADCPHITWIWMPRRLNRDADLLTRRAIRQARRDPYRYQEALREIQSGKGKRRPEGFYPLVDLRIYQPGVIGMPEANSKIMH